jgi:hypothetical protein
MKRPWIVFLVCLGLLATACAKLTPQSAFHDGWVANPLVGCHHNWDRPD